MKAVLFAGVGVVAALMLAIPASANGQAPVGDSASGSADGCLVRPENGCVGEDVFLSLDVRSGPAGEDPTGRVTWITTLTIAPDTVAESVTQASCLSVSGKVAIIGVSGTQTFLGFGQPVAGLIRVTDGGGPDSGEDSFEFATGVGDPQLPGPTDCSSFPTGGPTAVNTLGDLTVIDSSPLPTSRNQCNNGGWRNYPGFKNQGQCIAFVERGSKT
jgi:hypothetical protein